MASETPSGYAKVVCAVRLDGKTTDASFTFGVRNLGIVDPYTDPAEMAAAIKALLTVPTTAPFKASTTYVNYGLNSVTVFWNNLGVPEEGVAAGLVSGTLSDSGQHNGLLQSAAILVRKRTASGGRRNAGRMFVPFVSGLETDVDPRGIILSTTITSLQTKWNDVLSGLDGLGLPMVILHDESFGLTPTVVTALVVAGTVGTQRRRLN